jgi:WD40 repeat protein
MEQRHLFEDTVMKRLYVLTLLIILIIVVIAASGLLRVAVNKPEPHEDTIALSDAPYIYWYDDTTDAIVIERADGTDSRYFAPNTLPDDYSLGELNWSVSGEWVAWLVHHNSGPGYSVGQLRISRTDGTELLNLIPENADVRYIEWSPTDDYLFVVYQLAENATIVVAIIDVPASAIRAQMTLNGSFGWNNVPTTTYWLSDGSGVVANQTQLSDDFLLYLRTNGTSELYDRTIYLRYGYGRLIEPRRVSDVEALNSEYRIVVRDLVTQEERIIDSAGSPYTRSYTVYWNPTRTHALVWIEQCPTDISQPCAENLNLLNWEAGTITSLNSSLRIFQSNNEMYSVSNPMWSPDGRYVILGDEKGYPHVYDTQTNAEVDIFLEVENPHWAWTEDSTAILLMPTDAQVVDRYELATGEVNEQYIELPTNSFNPIVSPNGRYLLPLGMMDGQLIDLETQEEFPLSHHSYSTEAGRFNNIIWHEDGEWFIASEIVSYAGGGGGPVSSTIYQLNGDVRRELGIEGAAGFVPERAWRYLSAGQAESVVPEPEKRLEVGQNVWGVVWSPDGTQVVAYSTGHDASVPNQLTLWDVSGDTPQLIQSYETDFNCAPYPFACQMTWDSDNLLILTNYEAVQSWNIAMGEILELGIRGKTPDDISPFPLYDDGILSIIEHDMFVIEPSGEQQAFGTLSDFVYDTNTNMVITASIFNRSLLWDADTATDATDLHSLPIVARDLALSPDGTILAAASSNRVDLWAMDDLLSRIELSK